MSAIRQPQNIETSEAPTNVRQSSEGVFSIHLGMDLSHLLGDLITKQLISRQRPWWAPFGLKTSIVTPLLGSVHSADHAADRDGGTSVVVVHCTPPSVGMDVTVTERIDLRSLI